MLQHSNNYIRLKLSGRQLVNLVVIDRVSGQYDEFVWASWRLKSTATLWFVKELVQVSSKGNKAQHYLPFVRGIQQWLIDSFHKGPVYDKSVPMSSHHMFSAAVRVRQGGGDPPKQSTTAAGFQSFIGFRSRQSIDNHYKTPERGR